MIPGRCAACALSKYWKQQATGASQSNFLKSKLRSPATLAVVPTPHTPRPPSSCSSLPTPHPPALERVHSISGGDPQSLCRQLRHAFLALLASYGALHTQELSSPVPEPAQHALSLSIGAQVFGTFALAALL